MATVKLNQSSTPDVMGLMLGIAKSSLGQLSQLAKCSNHIPSNSE
jgi:hypothetical protein